MLYIVLLYAYQYDRVNSYFGQGSEHEQWTLAIGFQRFDGDVSNDQAWGHRFQNALLGTLFNAYLMPI